MLKITIALCAHFRVWNLFHLYKVSKKKCELHTFFGTPRRYVHVQIFLKTKFLVSSSHPFYLLTVVLQEISRKIQCNLEQIENLVRNVNINEIFDDDIDQNLKSSRQGRQHPGNSPNYSHSINNIYKSSILSYFIFLGNCHTNEGNGNQ